MNTMVKHKWIKIETEPHDLETHECTVCGCKRGKFWMVPMKWPDYLYTRNGIIFHEGRPDCYEDEPAFQHAMGEFNE